MYLVESYQTVIIVGETGCGKSTQIPQVGPAPAEASSASPSFSSCWQLAGALPPPTVLECGTEELLLQKPQWAQCEVQW